MQSSPSRRPGKRLENMIFFFFLFFKHSWEAQQKSLGLDARRRGAGCSLQPQELCQSHVRARRWGRAERPDRPTPCPGAGPASRGSGRRSLLERAASVRASPRLHLQPAGRATPPSAAISVRRDSDLVRGDPGFPPNAAW